MGKWCSNHSCDFIVSTGDNIYNDGVESTTDLHFADTWLEVYNYPGISHLPWYLTVGNHDHHTPGGEWYQVEYSNINKRWVMPSLAYSVQMAAQVSEAYGIILRRLGGGLTWLSIRVVTEIY